MCCECLVAQSCLIPCDPMDCSLPGCSVHVDFPGKNTGVVAIPYIYPFTFYLFNNYY